MPSKGNKGRERFDRTECSDTNHDWLLPSFSALHVLSSYFPGSGIRSRPASLMSTMEGLVFFTCQGEECRRHSGKRRSCSLGCSRGASIVAVCCHTVVTGNRQRIVPVSISAASPSLGTDSCCSHQYEFIQLSKRRRST
ncbi:hypothetical protein ARMGADRAFT_478346 [Armillaria gallica]|uniref:Uncharacterized protein n=1 Tax=Armillaria gallica TaxID=47427 RepID=A0A2H3DC96_ARMGA|nr:hypothetical protein ARMGADRAFT_478346 [Armillaria gallica]